MNVRQKLRAPRRLRLDDASAAVTPLRSARDKARLSKSEIKQREDEFYDDPVDLQTGMLYTVPSAQWGDAGRVFIRQSDPLPFTLLAAVPDMEIGGRS